MSAQKGGMKKSWLKEPRFYPRNGKQYPSVTTILKVLNKPAIKPWALNQMGIFIEEHLPLVEKGEMSVEELIKGGKDAHQKISQKAKDFGTRVHELLQQIATGATISLKDEPEEVVNGVNAYLQWERDVNLIHLPGLQEVKLYDDALEVAGTTDAIVVINGDLTVIDYKSSTGMYPEMEIQVGKYFAMYNATAGNATAKRAMVVRLDKTTGLPDAHEIKDPNLCAEVFDHLVPPWRYLYGK